MPPSDGRLTCSNQTVAPKLLLLKVYLCTNYLHFLSSFFSLVTLPVLSATDIGALYIALNFLFKFLFKFIFVHDNM